jgi:ketosteroid isomerase-like protein
MSQRQRADKEGAVRELISKWIDAYQHLDAVRSILL